MTILQVVLSLIVLLALIVAPAFQTNHKKAN